MGKFLGFGLRVFPLMPLAVIQRELGMDLTGEIFVGFTLDRALLIASADVKTGGAAQNLQR